MNFVVSLLSSSLLILVTEGLRVGLLPTGHRHGDGFLLRNFVHRLLHRAFVDGIILVEAFERRQIVARRRVLLSFLHSLIIRAAAFSWRGRVRLRRDGLHSATGDDLALDVLKGLMLRNPSAESLTIYLLLGTERAHRTDARESIGRIFLLIFRIVRSLLLNYLGNGGRRFR